MRARTALAVLSAAALLAGCAVTPDDPAVDAALGTASGSVARVIASHCDAGPSGGSAFAIGEDLVLTALHVAEGARTVSVRFSGHLPVLADAIGEDPTRDILLLRTRESLDVPPLALAVTPAVRGDVLGLVGYPIAGGGLVARQARLTATDFTTSFRGADQQFLRLDASSAGGNSGGAVVDASGRVQGLMVAVISSVRPSETSPTVTLALPAADLTLRIAQWTAAPGRTAVGQACAGESDTRHDPPALSVVATDPVADEVAQTIWLALSGWNAGERPSAGQQYSAAARAEGEMAGVEWLSLEVLMVSRTTEGVTAEVVTRSRTSGSCRDQRWTYGLTGGGPWLIDSVRAAGGATAC